MEGAPGKAAEPDKTTASSTRRIIVLRWMVAVLGVAFVVIGVARGEYLDALSKAVRVCLECIGIG